MAGFFTVVVGVTVAVLLHAVNFAMGCFSPAIQALRLHYVEFFDKFYRGRREALRAVLSHVLKGEARWRKVC